jgi:hypothetical protein
MKKLTEFLLAVLIFCVVGTPLTPSMVVEVDQMAVISNGSARVWYCNDPLTQFDGWYPEGETVKVLDASGELWKVTGQGVEFGGRKARMTGYVKPEHLTLLGID